MGGLRDSKKEALRAKLFDAALQRFRSDGYEATSVAAICKQVGIAKGTFFNHFPTKADVLAEWYQQIMDASYAATKARYPDGTGDALIAMAVQAVSVARAEPDLWHAKHAYAPLSAAIQEAETSTDAAVKAEATRLIARGIKQSELPASTDPEILADLYVALVTGTIREWLNTGGKFDLDERIQQRILALLTFVAT